MTTLFSLTGIVWILVSTLLSSYRLSNYHKRGHHKIPAPSSGAIGRTLAMFVLDVLAILAVAMYSSMSGVITLSFAAWQAVEVASSPYYLATAAWALTLPFAIDAWRATQGKLYTSTTYVVTRSAMLALRLMLVMVMMFA